MGSRRSVSGPARAPSARRARSPTSAHGGSAARSPASVASRAARTRSAPRAAAPGAMAASSTASDAVQPGADPRATRWAVGLACVGLVLRLAWVLDSARFPFFELPQTDDY